MHAVQYDCYGGGAANFKVVFSLTLFSLFIYHVALMKSFLKCIWIIFFNSEFRFLMFLFYILSYVK